MLYKGVKYACGTCIKGHRSSQCTHAERPLFEIRKKGRPVTQCSLCRDLRKTKQVHIKCACTHKSTKASAVVPDISDKYTCSDVNHDHPLPTTTAATQDDSAGYITHHFNTIAGGESYSSLLSSSSSSATIQQQQQPSRIDSSFAWALVTPTSEEESLLANDDTADLGFLFHKPSSRRFLDGQPRPPRKKSVKKQQPPPPQSSCQQQPITSAHSSRSAAASTMMVPTCSTTTMANSSQKHIMLPFMNMDLSSSTSSTTSSSSSSSSSSCVDGDMLSADMTMILNNVLEQQHADDQDLANSEVIYSNSDFSRWMDSTSLNQVSASSSTTDTLSHPAPLEQQQQQLQQVSIQPTASDCMYPGQAECQSKHTATGPGESVLITITPVPSMTSSSALQGKVRTRLATCYCASHCCMCPGCLVHPFAYGSGGGMVDPLALSSAASSIYSTSDDEEHHQQHQPTILLG